MNNRVKFWIVGFFLVLGGFVSESLKFASAETEEQLQQIAAIFSIEDALIVLGVIVLVIGFFVKK